LRELLRGLLDLALPPICSRCRRTVERGESLCPRCDRALPRWDCDAARAPGPPPQLVVPVSLHPSRLRSRGFNPAALLARSIARELGAPVDPTALIRVRDTPSQTGLDRSARRRNVRGAFCARPRLLAPPRVWLVDDVVTTGSTVAEAARALRRAGAKSVTAVCAARTPGPTAPSPSRR
jgi:predicted amidophosphoribosyltransferase